MRSKKFLSIFLVTFLVASFEIVPSFGESPWDKTVSDTKVELDEVVSSEVDTATATVQVNEEDSKDSKTKKEEEKEKKEQEEEEKEQEEENTGLATLPNGPAYVGAFGGLNVRTAPWGSINGAICNDEQVTITGRDGDWYICETSIGTGYCHARYIFSSPGKAYYGDDPDDPTGGSNGDNGGTVTTSEVVINVDADSVQGKVVQAAQQIHDKYQGYQSYPYNEYTEGGNLGCAQVATSVLVAAGVLEAVAEEDGLGYASLNCDGTISLLEDAGWTSVSWPPYQAGDVVFWETYCPGPSHVGIIMNSGNSAQAMNNSSSDRMPVYCDADDMTVCKVMRKL